jgi:outer membrane receptor protein involved in Fe transport
MSNGLWRRGLCGLAVSVAAICTAQAQTVPAAGMTQAPPGAEQNLAEIIVTAQKRSERIEDVPMTITAVTGAQLEKLGITETSELTKLVPGFGYQASVFGAPVFSIRGIGFYDNSISAGPTVTVYVDQVPLPYSAEARGATFDLERVEVLKGPQGTLFGLNSTGGAINYIAAKPMNEFSAGANVSYGRYNDVDATAFITGPLANDLSARLAVGHESADGWQQSATRPGDWLGRKDFTNVRLLLDWKPSDRLSLELNVSGWHDASETQAAQYQGFRPAVPVTPLTQYIQDAMLAAPLAGNRADVADWSPTTNYARDDNFFVASLRGDWQIREDVTLTSITAYSDLRAQDPMDISGTAFENFLVESHRTTLSSFSQELRIALTSDAFKWMIGGNYQSDVTNESEISVNQGTNNQIGPVLFTRLLETVEQKPETKSVFGSTDYSVSDTVTARASARYTSQDRSFSGCTGDAGLGPVGVSAATAFGFLSSALSGSPTVIPPGGCISMNPITFKPELFHSQLNEDNVSWRVGLDWKFDPNSLLYANVTQGYKSGSYSLVPAIISTQFTPVTQEGVLAYESGIKTSFFERKVQFDGALFYYDYKNKQVLGNVLTPVFGTLPELVNIPKSEVYGAELNAVLYPIRALRITGGTTYVMSRVNKDPTAPATPRDPFGTPTSYIGEAFPNTPHWQGMMDAEYDFPIVGSKLTGFVGGTGTYRGSSYAAFGESPAFKIASYALLDLRAGVESGDGHWTAQLWGRNVTDKYYWLNVSHLTDYVSRLAGMPATYGISVGYRY